MTDTRIERDPLGEKAVPADALYGIQTLRAAENFPISGLRPLPAFVDAVVWIKRSAALTHKETGRLDAAAGRRDRARRRRGAGRPASRPVRRGRVPGRRGHQPQHERATRCSPTGPTRSSARPRGSYAPVHPNDHVNMAQSTNDVIPTAMRLATLATLPPRCSAAGAAGRRRCSPRARRSTDIIKSGRTHLQDATPIRLGQEFTAYGRTVAAPPREAGPGGRLAAGDEHRRHGGRHRHQRGAGVSRRSW